MFFQSVVCDLGVQKKRLGMESQEEEVAALWGWKEVAEDISCSAIGVLWGLLWGDPHAETRLILRQSQQMTNQM